MQSTLRTMAANTTIHQWGHLVLDVRLTWSWSMDTCAPGLQQHQGSKEWATFCNRDAGLRLKVARFEKYTVVCLLAADDPE